MDLGEIVHDGGTCFELVLLLSVTWLQKIRQQAHKKSNFVKSGF